MYTKYVFSVAKSYLEQFFKTTLISVKVTQKSVFNCLQIKYVKTLIIFGSKVGLSIYISTVKNVKTIKQMFKVLGMNFKEMSFFPIVMELKIKVYSTA